MVLIPLILNYGINTNAMEIARFALENLIPPYPYAPLPLCPLTFLLLRVNKGKGA